MNLQPLSAGLCYQSVIKKPLSGPPWGATTGTHLVELLLGHVGLPLRAEGAESALDLLAGLHILRFPADHERHILLQRDVSIPAEKHSV